MPKVPTTDNQNANSFVRVTIELIKEGKLQTITVRDREFVHYDNASVYFHRVLQIITEIMGIR